MAFGGSHAGKHANSAVAVGVVVVVVTAAERRETSTGKRACACGWASEGVALCVVIAALADRNHGDPAGSPCCDRCRRLRLPAFSPRFDHVHPRHAVARRVYLRTHVTMHNIICVRHYTIRSHNLSAHALI